MTDMIFTPAQLRAARFEGIVSELRPILARAFPDQPEEARVERAAHIAAYRLAGGDMVWQVLG